MSNEFYKESKEAEKAFKKRCPSCNPDGQQVWVGRCGTFFKLCERCKGTRLIIDEKKVNQHMIRYIESRSRVD